MALGHYDIPDELLNSSDEEIAKDYENRYGSWTKGKVQREKERAQTEYDMYYLYCVDKPIVDFIRTEEKFQRQRVTLSLHQYANVWLKNNFGIHLWLSYCRTDQGKCFYDAKLLEVKRHKYKNKMENGFRRTREYVANNNNWYKLSKANIIDLDTLPAIEDSEDKELERAQKYFNIGHGDFVEEFGYEPDFQVWILYQGDVLKSKVFKIDPKTGQAKNEKTHRSLWGDLENNNFKGRYEPQTGRLTVVKPDLARFRDIPNEIINKIQRAFPRAKKIIVT